MIHVRKETLSRSAVSSAQHRASRELPPLHQPSRSFTFLKRSQIPYILAVWLVLTLACPVHLFAKVGGYSEPSRDLRFSFAVAPIYRFPADVDGGGTLSVFSLYFSADVMKQVNQNLGVGLNFIYEFDDYDFSGLTGFFVPRPWKEVQRLGFSVPIFYSIDDKWKVIVIPSAQFSGEFGARFGDALVYGGAGAVTYAFGPKVALGIGIAAYYNLKEVRVFPFPVIKLKLNDRFRFANPFRTGPAGPAGLELSYQLSPRWEVGIGGAYRSYRFRLDYNGPIPNGIGEYNSIPVFVRLGYQAHPALKVDFYAGASFLNKLYVDDRDGDELYRTKHDVAPLLGLSVSGRF
jgi:hypothetical protein